MRRAALAGAMVFWCAIAGAPGHAAPQAAQTANPPAPLPPGTPTARPGATLTPALARTVDPIIDAMWTAFRPQAAMETVRYVGQFWRLAGNAGYDASIDRVHARLKTLGIADVADPPPPNARDARGSGGQAPTPRAPKMWIESYPSGHGWDYSVGTVAIVRPNAPEQIVLSKAKERLALCINSFSTAPGGVTAPLVDVGAGLESDYAKADVKGAIVMGDAPISALWRRAIALGAIGVISGEIGEYVNPNAPAAAATPRDTWDILQWGSVPYDDTHKAFGFKATPHAMASLRAGLAKGLSTLHVTVTSSFSEKPARTLIMEIPGRVAPTERVVIAVHVQEPGANDNASGVATLTEMVHALVTQIRAGKIPPPARTMTFLWLEEIQGSRQWLKDHADDAKNVKFMFSMDMTGEDVKKTGGTFLIERWPDPGAVWDRPWDPHTEWGRGNVKADSLKGDLINDLHEAICRRVARRDAWVVNTNPYEGGSDHTVFGSAGIPAVLDWHFTDRYYHTNMDTPDKSSGVEMRNVGVSTATTAWLMASAREPASLAVADFLAQTGHTRLAFDAREGAKLAAVDPKPDDAKTREGQIAAAWKKWYAEAVRSVSRLVVGDVTPKLQQKIDADAATFEAPQAPSPIVSAIDAPSVEQEPAAAPSGPFVPDAQTVGMQGQPWVPAPEAIFSCGVDNTISDALALTWESVVLSGDSRRYVACPSTPHDATHREHREASVLTRAAASRDPTIRRLGVLEYIFNRRLPAIGLEPPPDPVLTPDEVDAKNATPARLFSDTDPVLRTMTATAMPDVFTGPAGVAQALLILKTQTLVEKDETVLGAMLESIGRLQYKTDTDRNDAEHQILGVMNREHRPAAVLGAVRGLDWLTRRNPRRTVGDDVRVFLRGATAVGVTTVAPPTIAGAGSAEAPGKDSIEARTRRIALTVLQTLRDTDADTLRHAAQDADWQVRRQVAAQLDAARPEQAPILALLSADPDFHVRFELVTALAREAQRTKSCARVIKLLGDSSPAVVIHVLDSFPGGCDDQNQAIEFMKQRADELRAAQVDAPWHIPAHALMALARMAPDQAAPIVDAASSHPIWQVRAYVATAAGTLRQEDRLTTLAQDAEPNVATSAINALVAMKSPKAYEAAIDALNGADDHQLLFTAAAALKGAPADVRDDATHALQRALDRLAETKADNSRDARVAIVDRLGELLPPESVATLERNTVDFDHAVRQSAAKAIKGLNGNEMDVLNGGQVRYPLQVTFEELATLPTTAHVAMADGTSFDMQLLVDQAPTTVAWFVHYVKAGYYDGLTIHRVEPNFVIQGGSPHANEYSGAPRFMRDELGTEPNLRGSVGLSTRGHDTGDAQFFVDLTDQPRLDHTYTVFARVTAGLDAIDRMLEGAKILHVTLR